MQFHRGDHRYWISSLAIFAACTRTAIETDGERPVVGQPTLGATVQADHAPPISGGTLALLRDGQTAIAADSDRDAIYVVSLSDGSVRTIAMQRFDEPGRVVEGDPGTAYVLLRTGGAVAVVNTQQATATRVAVCANPRGITYVDHQLFIACADGDLLAMDSSASAQHVFAHLADGDLRDVVVDGNDLVVSRFRAAELTRVNRANGGIGQTTVMPTFVSHQGQFTGSEFSPDVAWRTIANPRGGVVVVHQRALVGEVGAITNVPSGTPGGTGEYAAVPPADGPMCGTSIVQTTVSMVGNGGPSAMPEIPGAVVPVDVATSQDGSRFAVVSAANSKVPNGTQVFLLATDRYTSPSDTGCAALMEVAQPTGQVTAVAFNAHGDIVVQTREPATLQVLGTRWTTTLSSHSVEDTGSAIFHSNSGGNIACASCHPGGADDGRVWNFAGSGLRRTQNLRGGILETAPFHWDGVFADVPSLVHEVFEQRMSGSVLTNEENFALAQWINQVPLPVAQPIADASSVDRGRALFNDTSVGCNGCHSGQKLTNNATMSVGTNGGFQVPSLVGVRWRAPYMHNGCAATLADRFGPCGGGDLHGHTSQLNSSQIGDLVNYLQTL